MRDTRIGVNVLPGHGLSSPSRRSFAEALLLLFALVFPSAAGYGQISSPDFKTIPVNKKIGEFPDAFDMSSPLSACVSFNYLMLNGRESRLGPASSWRIRNFLAGPSQPDAQVSEKRRSTYLNTLINEVIVYKDAVACVISRPSEDYYSIRYMSHEGGEWLNAGEDMGMNLDECRKTFANKAALFYEYTKRIPILAHVPADAAPFARYLKSNGRDPKSFILEALAKHQLVIYGEIHRRQWSWDLCRSVLTDKAFAEAVGTIYMEISSHKQGDLDSFLAKDSLDPELVLGAFREIQIDGWPDKGMYEFLCEVWKLNRALPAPQRIRVVAVDIPRPLSTLRTADELKKYFHESPNRNAFMAETIEKDIRSRRDSRHAVFIVGTGHVYRTAAPGFASSSASTGIPSAGALLSARLPRGRVYSFFSHQPIIANNGSIQGRLRGGVFDEAFAANGNMPVAFDIHESPFGKEPFDALPEISFRTVTGTFADNYDGYIFLGPLDDEPADYLLPELYSEDFVKELSRRAVLEHTTVQQWFGVKEGTREAIVAKIKRDTDGKKRWGNLPPLKAAEPARQ